ncbi:MAG: carbohydrate kinase family protein [Chloroflexi bacterium]|nr:MAG: carbohydrate kinase family protein [Chloroflexota bacterium]
MSGMVEIVGGTTVDIYVSVARFPPGAGAEFGRSTLAHCGRAASLSVGGNGGLAAYILGRLGQPARLHTRLGRDFWGSWLRAQLEVAGVELASDSTDEESSTNIVATDGGGNRLSFFHALEAQYAVAAPSPDTRVMFLGGCPHPTAELIATYVRPYRNAGVTTVIDIGPSIPRPFRIDDLARLADALDLVTCNRGELRQLSGTSSLRRGAQVVHKLGIPTLVIKDGANGAVFSTSDDNHLHLVPVETIEPATGSVGAGDSFNAGLLYALANAKSVAVAVAFANQIARAVLRATDRLNVDLTAAGIYETAVADQVRVMEV